MYKYKDGREITEFLNSGIYKNLKFNYNLKRYGVKNLLEKKKRCKDERMKRQIDHRIKNLISDIIELDKMIADIEKKMESK